MSVSTGTTVSGYCPHCSWVGRVGQQDKLVFHTSPWCPRMFPTAWIDSNATHRDEDGHDCPWTITEHVSRPVAVGELVLLVDTGDGEEFPFATWGRVTEVGRRIVKFEAVAEDNRYLYVEGCRG